VLDELSSKPIFFRPPKKNRGIAPSSSPLYTLLGREKKAYKIDSDGANVALCVRVVLRNNGQQTIKAKGGRRGKKNFAVLNICGNCTVNQLYILCMRS
jgi:hypothetical protein